MQEGQGSWLHRADGARRIWDGAAWCCREKSLAVLGCRLGRTDEKITTELSPVAPLLRGPVETKSSKQEGW